MITQLKVSNFRSLGENVVLDDLGPLTILVGQNGSGKSNVVDLFRFIADCMRLGLESAITNRHGIGAVRRWSSSRPFNLSLAVTVKGVGISGSYEFTLAGARTGEYQVTREKAAIFNKEITRQYSIERGSWVTGPPDLRPEVNQLNLALPLMAGDARFRPLAELLRNMEVYSIFPDTLREPQKYNPTKPMDGHGANWVSIMKDQPAQTWKPELLAALGKLTGDIEDMQIKPVGSHLNVRFKHVSNQRRAKWFDAAQESDGTLRVAGLITALLQESPLVLIGVEEPELTVHPGAIEMVVDFIRQASKQCQVILTTHSPVLLDCVQADEVRVVERVDGATTVSPMAEDQKDVVQQRLMTLGELARSEGLRSQRRLPFD